jgi:predicted nucleic acid-binding protein
MAVCLDSTFLVDLLAGRPEAIAFVETLAEPAAISAISFYELIFGVVGRRRLARVEALGRDYPVLPADYQVCAMAASIQTRLSEIGQLIPVLDAIIAGTAVLAELPLVTTDEHFDRIPSDFGLVVRPY